MKRILGPWARFLAADRSLTFLLLLLIAFSFILPPLSVPGARRGIPMDVIFSLLILSGMWAAWKKRGLASRFVAAMSLGALALNWLTRLAPPAEFAAWNVMADLIALISIALVVLAKVVAPGNITSHRLMGAVAVYLLVGLAWSNAFECAELINPGSFTGLGVGSGQRPSWIYYSFVTLTTMGYGDITPVHPVARSLAIAEAITGQLYIAILISRLVALEVSSHQKS